MKTLISIPAFFISTVAFAQNSNDFLVVHEDTTFKERIKYVFLNYKGDTITRLDTSKYYIRWNHIVEHFAIVGLKNRRGWWAIDKDENILFQVFKTSSGEPSPDFEMA
jgi:hypothetical protein